MRQQHLTDNQSINQSIRISTYQTSISVKIQLKSNFRCLPMDILCYGLTFDLDNKNEIPGKNLLKVMKFQNLVGNCCNVWKI